MTDPDNSTKTPNHSGDAIRSTYARLSRGAPHMTGKAKIETVARCMGVSELDAAIAILGPASREPVEWSASDEC